MGLKFMPHDDDMGKTTLDEKLDVLMEAAERYKADVLDASERAVEESAPSKLTVPREIKIAYNWEEIAKALREIREMPELSPSDKTKKSNLLTRLAEVYEVLRAAKMSKLEAVRLALIGEAAQLKGGSTAQVL